MEKGEVTISQKALDSLGAKPRDSMPIDRQPDPSGQNQGGIEKTLSPRRAEKVYGMEMKLKVPSV